MHQNTTSDTIRKCNPLHIEEYSPCNLPLTENIKHLKLNYHLIDSISHQEPIILSTLNLKWHIMNQLHFQISTIRKWYHLRCQWINFFNSLKHMKVITKHTLNCQNYRKKHSLQLKQLYQTHIHQIKSYYY